MGILSKLSPHLLYQFRGEAELLASIEKISQIFNHKRDMLESYVSSEKLVSAYTLFYLSTNLPKLNALLDFLSPKLVEELSKASMIEFGAGPGTFMQAWAESFGAERVEGAVESSALMREQAQKLWKAFYPEHPVTMTRDLSAFRSQKNQVLLFAHSANEMGAELVAQEVEKIQPRFLLFIEPGTQQSFETLLELRETLLEQGHRIHYPCPSNMTCPSSVANWCHQVITVKHDQEVQRLCQLVRKDRNKLPVIFHLYERDQKGPPSFSDALLFRIHKETKYGLIWELCLAGSEQNKLQMIELFKKDYSKARWKEIRTYSAGKKIQFERVKELGDGSWRCRLLD